MVARQLDDAIISTVDKKPPGDYYAPVCQVWGSTHDCVEEETSTHKHAYCLCFRDMYVYEVCHFLNFFGGNPSRCQEKATIGSDTEGKVQSGTFILDR